MRINAIFTGGTIGSKVNSSGQIALHEAGSYELINEYQKSSQTECSFITQEPYTILSENLEAKQLNQLILAVHKACEEHCYEGIVIMHGTDTLAYSAAVLGYVFGAVEIPIVLVSSDYPLDDERANGTLNFHGAMDFIKAKAGQGVFVSYCNKGDVVRIHRGTRLLSHMQYTADVRSVEDQCYGWLEQDQFHPNPNYQVEEGKPALSGIDFNHPLLENAESILRVIPYVGMVYPRISKECRVILMESYHSGTVGVTESLKKFAREARERNIPIFVSGLQSGLTEYETVQQYRNLGLTPLREGSVIAQYAKLWLLLSNCLLVTEWMEQEVAEE